MALLRGKMDTRTQRENEPLQGCPEIFWYAKDFATAHELAAGHVKFKKASCNSNRYIRQNVTGDGDRTQNNTSGHFSKMGRR